MIQYTSDDVAALVTDALIIEVDCLGKTTQTTLAKCQRMLDDVVTAYKDAFAAGRIEPGQVLALDRGTKTPKHVFLLPARVHPLGAIKNQWIVPAISGILEQVLRQSVKSLAVLAIHDDDGIAAAPLKLPLLHALSRVPDIHFTWISPRKSIKQVTIFTDGGAIPNSGVGGYGVLLRFGETTKELSEGFKQSTIERMELMAVVVGLEALKHSCRVRLYCDSRYVVDAINQEA